jgi:hypothetical protein
MIPMARKSAVDPHIGQRLKEYRQHRGAAVMAVTKSSIAGSFRWDFRHVEFGVHE